MMIEQREREKKWVINKSPTGVSLGQQAVIDSSHRLIVNHMGFSDCLARDSISCDNDKG